MRARRFHAATPGVPASYVVPNGARAQTAPTPITFQGALADNRCVAPPDGSLRMRFRLYRQRRHQRRDVGGSVRRCDGFQYGLRIRRLRLEPEWYGGPRLEPRHDEPGDAGRTAEWCPWLQQPRHRRRRQPRLC